MYACEKCQCERILLFLTLQMQAHYDNVRADSLDAVISLVQKQQSSHRIAPSSLHS